jgi:hypothetical protein
VLALVALLVIVLFLAQRLWLGYPRRPGAFFVIGAGDAAFLEAAAKSFFPQGAAEESPGHEGAPVQLAERVDRYLAVLPGRQRTLIRLLLLLFEQSTIVLPARGVGAFRRFSSMSPEQREQTLQGWAESRFYLRRAAFTALKAVLVVAWVGDPECLRALGLAPYEIPVPVLESDLLYPPIGGTADDITLGPQDVTGPGELPPLSAVGAVE